MGSASDAHVTLLLSGRRREHKGVQEKEMSARLSGRPGGPSLPKLVVLEKKKNCHRPVPLPARLSDAVDVCLPDSRACALAKERGKKGY